jgi:hypothetical protein
MYVRILVLGLALTLAAGDSHSNPNAGNPELLARYPNFLVLTSKTYELYWNYTKETSRLDIAVRVKTTGWVGLGVSEKGSMVNSDLAVGWVTDQGETVLQDRYAGANGFPPEDTRHDLNLIRGEEKHGWTTLEFWRYLDTGDTGSTGGVNHDRIITEGSTPVIFAYGDSDTFSYHMSRRGSYGVYFLGGDELEPEVEAGAKTLDFLVRNITIPSADTTYWCAGFRTPRQIKSTVKHMIRFSPVIHEPATPHVHHMILYSCDGINLGSLTDEDLIGGECLTNVGQASTPLARCTTGNLIAAWAVGGEAFTFPQDLSFSFGGPQSSEYWMIEMHYDNPNMISGVTDYSGMQITYIDTPRKYDAGSIAVGATVTPFMVIPPHQENFNVYGICDTSCTGQHFPEEGVTVFASILHTHLAGHGLVLKQYRNGLEVMPPIDQDLNYDFNFQQVRTIPSRKIYPNDKLELLCQYSTQDRNSTATGGLGTYQEMCLAFMYYYPKTPLLLCNSRLKIEFLLQALRVDQIPSFNQSSPSSVQQFFGITLQDPSFPWDQHSRVPNLQGLYSSAATNSSYLDFQCFANEASVVKYSEDVPKVIGCSFVGSSALLWVPSTVMMLTAAAITLIFGN